MKLLFTAGKSEKSDRLQSKQGYDFFRWGEGENWKKALGSNFCMGDDWQKLHESVN